MLAGPLHEPGLLAELADVLAVVVGEHVHLKDGLRHLGGLLQVHGQELRLQSRLVRPVCLQGIQEDRGSLLESVLIHENLDHLVDVNERNSVLSLQQALGKIGRPLRVDRDHVLQKSGVVCLVSDLLHVGHNLLVLSLLHKACDHLLVCIGPEVHGQGKPWLQRLDDVAQLLGALQTILFEPLFDELPSLLLHHGADQLHRLESVQFAVLEQGREVVQDWGRLAWHGRHALELLDRLRGSQDTALALCRNQGGSLVVA
mmetsp:Transcript_743/g.1768  ORF Transcript_743/g.1768 Transcript_743/m.1768 type:complete len:258 (-) Transcript_743:1251-2024(-)